MKPSLRALSVLVVLSGVIVLFQFPSITGLATGDGSGCGGLPGDTPQESVTQDQLKGKDTAQEQEDGKTSARFVANEFLREIKEVKPRWQKRLMSEENAIRFRVFELVIPKNFQPTAKKVAVTLFPDVSVHLYRQRAKRVGNNTFFYAATILEDRLGHLSITYHNGRVKGQATIRNRFYRFLTLDPGIHAVIEFPRQPEYACDQAPRRSRVERQPETDPQRDPQPAPNPQPREDDRQGGQR